MPIAEVSPSVPSEEILIRGLRFDCIIGILPAERVTLQPLVLDLTLGVDFSPLSSDESREGLVDYGAISAQLIAHCQASEYQLLETLVRDCAALLLAHWPIKSVDITALKPDAVPAAEAVGVRLHLRR